MSGDGPLSKVTYMKINRSVAALIGALLLAGVVTALEWYSHVAGANRATPTRTVQAVSPEPSPMTAAPSPQTSSSQRPIVYVPAAQPSSQPAAPSTTGSPAPTATQASPAPLNPGATATPQPLAGPLATLAPTSIMPQVLREPPDAPPRILAMSLSTPVAKGGEVVSGTVETSSNVASVEARIGGYSTSMQKVGTGKFQLSYRVPSLPFFLHRTYMIQVIARNAKGQAVSTALPITLR